MKSRTPHFLDGFGEVEQFFFDLCGRKNHAASLKLISPVWNQGSASWFCAAVASEARASDPVSDQLIPLCFCRSETTKSFCFSPQLLELRSPNFLRTE